MTGGCDEEFQVTKIKNRWDSGLVGTNSYCVQTCGVREFLSSCDCNSNPSHTSTHGLLRVRRSGSDVTFPFVTSIEPGNEAKVLPTGSTYLHCYRPRACSRLQSLASAGYYWYGVEASSPYTTIAMIGDRGHVA